MSATATPYGFQIASSQVGIVRTLRMPLGIANTFGSSIFKYQPVKIVAGVLQPITATTDPIFGFMAGVEYTPVGGRPAVSPFWAASTNYDTGYDMNVYVWPAWLPDLRIRVQANGSVGQSAMGQQFNIVTGSGSYGIAAGSTQTGLSAAGVNATPPGTGQQGQFAFIEFDPEVGDPASGPGTSAGGDAFTDLIVTVARQQVVGGIQTSI